jgi:hypothetical protein
VVIAVYGKLFNQEGELVAEGSCEVNDDRRSVTLRPPFEMPLLERQRGALRLELEDGSELSLSSKVFRFRTNLPGYPPGNVYRLFLSSGEGTRNKEQGTGNREHGWEQGAGNREQGTRDREQGWEQDRELPPEFRRE